MWWDPLHPPPATAGKISQSLPWAPPSFADAQTSAQNTPPAWAAPVRPSHSAQVSPPVRSRPRPRPAGSPQPPGPPHCGPAHILDMVHAGCAFCCASPGDGGARAMPGGTWSRGSFEPVGEWESGQMNGGEANQGPRPEGP